MIDVTSKAALPGGINKLWSMKRYDVFLFQTYLLVYLNTWLGNLIRHNLPTIFHHKLPFLLTPSIEAPLV
jgi:hypothetical protein